MKTVVFCLAFLALSGCTIVSKKMITMGPATAPPQAADVEAGARICDVDSLATQKNAYVEQVGQLRAESGNERSATDLDKMKAFEAEIDAQYRTVTASCRAFVQCMEMHGYDEGACRMSQRRWEDSEQDFSALAIRLRELSVPPSRGPAPRRSNAAPAPKPCKPSCAEIGNIFTDCCTD